MSDYQPRRAAPPPQTGYGRPVIPTDHRSPAQQPVPFGVGEWNRASGSLDPQRYTGEYAPAGQGHAAPPRRKRRRVFLWVFLALQALFIIWVIAGAATKTAAPASQIASACYHHQWFPLFKSQADCVTHFGSALNTAGNAGKAIGVGLIIVFWMVVDVILGVSYGVYRLATRDRDR